jgi:hypothetical protein
MVSSLSLGKNSVAGSSIIRLPSMSSWVARNRDAQALGCTIPMSHPRTNEASLRRAKVGPTDRYGSSRTPDHARTPSGLSLGYQLVFIIDEADLRCPRLSPRFDFSEVTRCFSTAISRGHDETRSYCDVRMSSRMMRKAPVPMKMLP